MLALAVPLIGLYFMAGGIATLNDRRRAKKSDSVITPDGRISKAEAIEAAKPITDEDPQ
jgi:hypothetical protein